MNEDVNRNRKLFRKEVSYAKGGKVELQQNKGWKWEAGTGGGQSERDLYNIDTQEEVAVHMCGLDRIRRGNYYKRRANWKR